MLKRIVATVFIFLFITVAWMVLGGAITSRTYSSDSRLQGQVSSLWGQAQTQITPTLAFEWLVRETEKEEVVDPATQKKTFVTKEKWVWKNKPVILDSSDIKVDFHLDYRQKGLLWYSTYSVAFAGDYSYTHDEDRNGYLVITYRFPTTQANYDDFRFTVNGQADPKITPISAEGTKIVQERIPIDRNVTVPFTIAYKSRGLEWWRYSFGTDVNRVKNFKLAMTTDFKDIDFPQGTISPTSKQATSTGWNLSWSFNNLISGFQIGMQMPAKINPGPLAAQISFFAPLSLAFFFVWMFVITLLKKIDLHPMNFLFLGASFFSFHILFSYLVDHIDIAPAFAAASATSVILVVTYLRLAIGMRFAALEAGVSQLIYLVFFSYAHFLKGYTGLIVTVGGILTLFAVMQLTGRIKWSEKFAKSAVLKPRIADSST